MRRSIGLASLLAIGTVLALSSWLPTNDAASAGQGKGGEVIAKPTPTPKKTTTTKKNPPAKRPTSRRPEPSKSNSESTAPMGMNIVLNRTGDDGSISGVVAWSGPAPTYKIDTSADPVCGQRNPNLLTENYLVTNGKVANVFVYIEDGTTTDGWKLSDLMFDVPTEEVVLDQSGCRFVPHVVGLQVNQTLSITNSDPTTHNVHFTPTNNPDWNQTQPSGAAPLTRKFSYSEIMVPVRNNQHPWMKAYVGILKHPFFAVTSEDGSFQIRGVPPGTYTLVAWHEATGLKSEGITARTVVTVRKKSKASLQSRLALNAG